MPHIELKTVEQLRWMREAELVVASIHEALRAAVRPGVTTRELDEVSAQAIADGGGTSNFLGYYGYPATQSIRNSDENLSAYLYGTYDFDNGLQAFATLNYTQTKAKLSSATPHQAHGNISTRT